MRTSKATVREAAARPRPGTCGQIRGGVPGPLAHAILHARLLQADSVCVENLRKILRINIIFLRNDAHIRPSYPPEAPLRSESARPSHPSGRGPVGAFVHVREREGTCPDST